MENLNGRCRISRDIKRPAACDNDGDPSFEEQQAANSEAHNHAWSRCTNYESCQAPPIQVPQNVLKSKWQFELCLEATSAQ